MIAVTFALPSESSAFTGRLTERSRTGHVVSGKCEKRRVCVLHTGVGEKAASARIGAFLETESPALLISAGFAGGLTDTWTTGDLLLAQNFTSAELFAVAQRALPGARSAALATAQDVVDSAAARAQLAAAHGADAVDMETEFIAAHCQRANIPMVSLRVISDTPAAPFPAPAAVLFNIEQQRTDPLRLMSYLAVHPLYLVEFARFAGRIGRARRTLADALQRLIGSALVSSR